MREISRNSPRFHRVGRCRRAPGGASVSRYNRTNLMGTTTSRGPQGSAVRCLEERRALLQRVLWSPQIEKSTRIRDLLTYLCERTFEEPAAEIHEQEIGQRVFGRPPAYETAVDNVVRVTVSQARKKLEQYFAA